jgi:hypothetical protein
MMVFLASSVMYRVKSELIAASYFLAQKSF